MRAHKEIVPASVVDPSVTYWYKLLPRWSLFTGLALFIFFVLFGFLRASTQDTPGLSAPDADELVAASSAPALYRVAMTLDAIVWLAVGALLITLAALLARRAPVRSTFIAACGIGQLAGVIAAFIRIGAVTDIAARYTAAMPSDRPALLRSFLDVDLIIGALTDVHWLLASIGLVLAASVAWSMTGFPRWLAIGLALPGILGLLHIVFQALTGASLGPLGLLGVLLLMVLCFAIAGIFWRRMPMYAPEVGDTPPVAS